MQMQACPHPECFHTGTVITKMHCKLEHNMDRDMLFKTYGEPKVMTDKSLVLMGEQARYANGYRRVKK